MATSDRFIQGNYAPVTEEITATDLPVIGTIPSELDGRLLRIGPNPVEGGNPRAHWFTGTGMAHGIRIREGRADWYRNRYVVSDRVSARLDRPITPGPRFHNSEGTANTNIIELAGQTLALVEGGGPIVRLTDELETVESTDLDGTFSGSFSAHPKRDPRTGELHVAAYHWTWNAIRYLVVGSDGRVSHTADVPLDHSPMVHDIALTDSAVLLFDFPCHFNLERAMAGHPLPYHWVDDTPARIGVLPRHGSAAEVRWCEVDPCFVFHPMNAFDCADGSIQVDVVRHDSMFRTVSNGPAEGRPTLDRWVLDPATGQVTETRLDDRGQEFPRHDDRLVGQPYRFGYTVGSDGGEGPGFRHDLLRGTTEVHDFGPGSASQEMVFVPRHPEAAEDDGWILSYVHNGQRNAAEVVILNAADFSGEPQAVIPLPQRVPFGFHGNWIPERPANGSTP